MSGFGTAFREWWPIGKWIALAIGVAILSIGNLYRDVADLKKADNREIERRITALEEATDTDTVVDWSTWRTSVDGKIEVLEGKVRCQWKRINGMPCD